MEGEGGWEVKKIYDVARQANRIRRSSQNYKKQKNKIHLVTRQSATSPTPFSLFTNKPGDN